MQCHLFYRLLGTSQSNISQHLAKMRDLGVVDYEKEGQTVYYFIKDESIKNIMSVLFDEKKGEIK